MLMSDLVKYGVLAGVGYFLYKKYYAAPAAAVVTGPVGNPVQYVPLTVTQQLDAAAKGGADYLRSGGLLNADQWNFFWAKIGKPAVDGAVFDALFFPSGRPSDTKDNPKMSSAQFVSSVATAGLSGFASAVGMPSPGQLVAMRRRAAVNRLNNAA